MLFSSSFSNIFSLLQIFNLKKFEMCKDSGILFNFKGVQLQQRIPGKSWVFVLKIHSPPTPSKVIFQEDVRQIHIMQPFGTKLIESLYAFLSNL